MLVSGRVEVLNRRFGANWAPTLPETNSKFAPEKWMVGRFRYFPFGLRFGLFSGGVLLLVSGRLYISLKETLFQKSVVSPFGWYTSTKSTLFFRGDLFGPSKMPPKKTDRSSMDVQRFNMIYTP